MRTDRHRTLPASPLLIGGTVALLYFLTARLGLGLYIAEGTATLVWPPTGVAIAALLLFGQRLWPAVTAGALVTTLSIGVPPLAAVAMAIGNTAEAMVAVLLLQRLAIAANPFDTVRGNLLYVLVAALAATPVSALVGAAATVASGIRPPESFANLFLMWWIGDLAGALLLAPLLFLLGIRWLDQGRPDGTVRWGMTGRYLEFALVTVLAVTAAMAIHGSWLPQRMAGHLSWLPFLLLLWAARRFSPLATVAVSFLVSLATVSCVLDSGTLRDQGHVTERLLYLYTFLFVQAIAALVTSSFVHERRLMVRELQRTREEAREASAQKSRFLANMSHEIRTPLNGIIGMTSLLEEEATSREQRERLRIIHNSANSLLNILNDIIDHARIEAGKLSIDPRVFPLQPLLRDVVGLFQPQAEVKGISLGARLAGDLPSHVLADDTRLRQILVNLLSNAVKFTDRGRITLEVFRDDRQPDTLLFVVTDTGIGIPADALERVLQPFTQADASTTRRHGGSGLGLTISRQLAEHMGGSLTLRSHPGNGTVVEVRLPLPEATPASAPVRQAGGLPMRNGIRPVRVLLAEDNPVNVSVTRQLLEKLGCQVSIATDGEQALARAGEGHDLVLMDCHMPRRDGYETCRAIRARERATGRHVPIIGLTASTLPDERDRCLGAGMDDYVAKPVRVADLAFILGRYVSRA